MDMPCRLVPIIALICVTCNLLAAVPNVPTLQLHTRSRDVGSIEATKPKATEKTINWDPQKTAIIVVDMWDDHWCKGAAKRVAELAVPMNEMLKEARAKGAFIIHCPSSVT